MRREEALVIDSGISGRVALVTGANHGIGAAIAKVLASEGARVFLTYLRVPSRSDPAVPEAYNEARLRTADAVIYEIRALGGTAESWEADLTLPDTAPRLFARAEASLGPVEILINNADFCEADSFLGDGIGPNGQLAGGVTAASHDAHFAVNSRAAALLIDEFAQRHRARGANWGRIVSITSAGRNGFTGEASYGASKAALESYTYTAAWELAEFGVTANIVEPMGTDTGWINDALAERIKAESPFGHVGRPEEVADAVLFFASQQARYLTGQRLQLQ
jgi:3-oxoacyl-[acyl-carrier protein] reductase